MLNWAIYSYNVNKPQSKFNESDTCSANNPDGKSSVNDFISITELAVPMCLSLLLSLIHSQIVATSSANVSTSGAHNKGPIQPHRKKRERKKRRKSTRSRSSMNETKSRTNSLTEDKEAIEANAQITRRLSSQQQQQPQQQQQQSQSQPQQQAQQQNVPDDSPPRLRKRLNVNWRSPIKSNQCPPDIVRTINQPQELAKNAADATEQHDMDNAGNEHETIGADDDGFESLNGKSSSGEEMSAARNNNGQLTELNLVDNENRSGGNSCNNNQQYANSAYLMGTFDDNDVNNDSDNNLINATNGISENVS